MIAKVELPDPGSKRRKVKWWEWFVLAAVLELYVPARRKGQKVGLWDWVVIAAVISSAVL